MVARTYTNDDIGEALETLAGALEERGANPHRVQAYRFAAESARQADASLATMYEAGGVEALRALPGVGESIASRIAGFLKTGRLILLEELREAVPPVQLLARVAGIGPTLAARIHEVLGIETLEDLERAAHDGRLERLEGFGVRRAEAVRGQLNTLLSRASRRALRRSRHRTLRPPTTDGAPPVALLLRLDHAYRTRAARGELDRIAPRRFNPSGEAWLPLLHAQYGGWDWTALFSNTARAHTLGKTDDWVVVYYERDGREGQATVVTESRGPLAGRRVVRGREAECRALYECAPRREAA